MIQRAEEGEPLDELKVSITAPKKGVPIFTDAHGRRWSIGSRVIVSWWARTASGMEEQQDEAEVVGIMACYDPGKPWRIFVSFGPLLDLASRPQEVAPEQVHARSSA